MTVSEFLQSRVTSGGSYYLTSFVYLSFYRFLVFPQTLPRIPEPRYATKLSAPLLQRRLTDEALLSERSFFFAPVCFWKAGSRYRFLPFDEENALFADGLIRRKVVCSSHAGGDLACALFARMKGRISDDSGYLYIGLTLSGYNVPQAEGIVNTFYVKVPIILQRF
ncbi:MAG: hypothetical protein HFF39_05025 [Lawsonibacter sp.]|nr:hypothetical protein [Lawsonibacter sp.]